MNDTVSAFQVVPQLAQTYHFIFYEMYVIGLLVMMNQVTDTGKKETQVIICNVTLYFLCVSNVNL